MNPTYSGTNITGGGQNLQIGGGNDGDFEGQIANIKMYNRALSTPEVLHNYNALKSRFT